MEYKLKEEKPGVYHLEEVIIGHLNDEMVQGYEIEVTASGHVIWNDYEEPTFMGAVLHQITPPIGEHWEAWLGRGGQHYIGDFDTHRDAVTAIVTNYFKELEDLV